MAMGQANIGQLLHWYAYFYHKGYTFYPLELGVNYYSYMYVENRLLSIEFFLVIPFLLLAHNAALR
ncbi:hypothetical protein EAY03_24395, partial [Vibrio anguillarum]|nr:hypothetical protein [Vibrio anguillarum]MBF4312908.1 hypothetical protein [Vibrio anguillarum]